MNIYYFNITYSCNSNCVFCYSHNTIHSGRKFNEIELYDFVEYLKSQNIQESDRVIINGGEPFLHSQILDILKSLLDFKCEVLIYTNGRCLTESDFSFMTSKYRFVIPVHGYKEIHDDITRSLGSYDSMANGVKHLNKFKCKIDVKVILNPKMTSSLDEFKKTINAIETLGFNNALHITKMADTIVSQKNGIPSVHNDKASYYTLLLFNHFKCKDVMVKMFDTCVKDLEIYEYEGRDIPIRVFFKDAKTSWEFKLYTPTLPCKETCPMSIYCESAVGNYTILEYNNHKFYKGTE